MKKKLFKQIFILFIIINILIVSFCSGTNKTENNNTNITNSTNNVDGKGTLINQNIQAPSLKNNMFKTITEQAIIVYLPPSYEASDKKYPVLYFLPGFSTSITAFTSGTFQGFRLQESMDELINEGKIKEMIVVIPNGGTFMLGSFYVNSPVRGNWEDFIVKDLVNYIDNNYRTIPNAKSRGIAGHSMGGYGALNLAMLHPEIYCATYGLCPGLFDENGLSKSSLFSNTQTINIHLEKVKELETMNEEDAKKEFISYIENLSNSNLIFSFAYGSAFSPNPDKKVPYIDYPYHKEGGELILNPEIWKNYENGFGNLAEKVKLYKDNFLKLKAIVIDYGSYDYYKWIPEGCIYFSEQLKKENIAHELLSFNSGHGDIRKRIEKEIFPFFSDVLNFE